MIPLLPHDAVVAEHRARIERAERFGYHWGGIRLAAKARRRGVYGWRVWQVLRRQEIVIRVERNRSPRRHRG